MQQFLSQPSSTKEFVLSLFNSLPQPEREDVIMAIFHNPPSQEGHLIEKRDVYIGSKAAADLLGLKLQTVYDMVHRKQVPYYKNGKIIRFLESELMAWVKCARVSTRDENEKKADEFLLSRENA